MNRYVLREIAVPFGLSLLILTVTALLSKVIKIIELMVTHGIGLSFIFWFLVSVIPTFLIYTIPVSFLVGVLAAFTRLSSDSEITAIKASGVSLFRLMKPVAFMAAVGFAATLACTFYLYPWGNANIKKLLVEAARSKLVSGIEEKTFYDKFKGVVLYIDRLSTKTGEMEGVFISQESGGKESNIFFAKRGEFSPSEGNYSVYLKLYDGSIHRRTEQNSSYHIADFSAYTLELNLAGGGPSEYADKPNREMYVAELSDKVKAVEAKGGNTAPYIIDLHKRFALPASVFVFALLGVPLGIQKVRVARFTGFSISLGVVLCYYVVSTALEALGENSSVPPVAAVWGSDVLFGLIGYYILRMAAMDKPATVRGFFTGSAFRRVKG